VVRYSRVRDARGVGLSATRSEERAIAKENTAGVMSHSSKTAPLLRIARLRGGLFRAFVKWSDEASRARPHSPARSLPRAVDSLPLPGPCRNVSQPEVEVGRGKSPSTMGKNPHIDDEAGRGIEDEEEEVEVR